MNLVQAFAAFLICVGMLIGLCLGKALGAEPREALLGHAARIATEHGLPPDLLMAVCDVESAWRPHAIGDNGRSFGLCQVQPDTALPLYGPRWRQDLPPEQRLAIVRADLRKPLNNLTIAAMHLRELLDKFDGEETLALIAYNGGARNASIVYVEKVRRARKKYAGAGACSSDLRRC